MIHRHQMVCVKTLGLRHATLADLPGEPRATDPLMADDDSARSAGQYLCPADPVPEGLLRTPGLPVHRLAGPKQTRRDAQ